MNRWLGGNLLTIRAIDHLTADLRPAAEISILDVATGSADLPEAISTWAGRRGRGVHLLVSDLGEQILGLARRRVSVPMEFLVADGRFLPLSDRSVDVVICSLVLHHLDPDGAVKMIGEMWRVARHGIVLNDLVRSRLSYWGAQLLCRVFTTNPLTRHDGPLSVLRSYTSREIEILAARAGVERLVTSGSLGYRVAVYSRR